MAFKLKHVIRIWFSNMACSSLSHAPFKQKYTPLASLHAGFYSAFLVADKITVTTKNADDGKAWVWESEINSSSYSIRARGDFRPLTRPAGKMVRL